MKWVVACMFLFVICMYFATVWHTAIIACVGGAVGRVAVCAAWGCALGQPVRQASALACEGSVCAPQIRKKEGVQ